MASGECWIVSWLCCGGILLISTWIYGIVCACWLIDVRRTERWNHEYDRLTEDGGTNMIKSYFEDWNLQPFTEVVVTSDEDCP